MAVKKTELYRSVCMELRKMMNAYIVMKRTPLTILLEIAISLRFSFSGLLTGLVSNKIKLDLSSEERLLGIRFD